MSARATSGKHNGGRVSLGSSVDLSEKGKIFVGWRIFEAVYKTVLTDNILFLVLQIGNLENYYHFYHSKTFKRSTVSSRGPHTFLRMDPQVQDTFLRCFLLFVWVCDSENA